MEHAAFDLCLASVRDDSRRFEEGCCSFIKSHFRNRLPWIFLTRFRWYLSRLPGLEMLYQWYNRLSLTGKILSGAFEVPHGEPPTLLDDRIRGNRMHRP